ncbi:MAG: cytochrome c [Vicingaceae bacterium]
MNKKRITGILSVIGISLALWACNPESPGVEYMPDMYRSPAIESYVDNDEYGNTNKMSARLPVAGSIPQGFAPFGIPGSLEGYESSGEQLMNPLPKSTENIAQGKELYGYFCKHCHGAKGDGKGSITNAIYGAVPSYSDTTPNRRGGRSMSQLKEGHIYHTIMYGLNAMGPHSSQINQEERWKIIMYVQTLQGNKTDEVVAVDEAANVSEMKDQTTN